jgi:hypothetical protein
MMFKTITQTIHKLNPRRSKVIKNNPELAGQNAGRAVFFDLCQLKLFPVHTRFESVQWFVTDAMTPDPETGNPAVVIQAESKDKALKAIIDLKALRKRARKSPGKRTRKRGIGKVK